MNPPVWMTKLAALTLMAAAGVLAPALAAPAASASTRNPTIVLGGFTDHGYKVAVVLHQDEGNTATVEFDFMRREGRQYQLYTYDYASDAAFKSADGLRKATVKANFGKAGEISLNLRFAAKFARRSLPDQYAFYGPFADQVRARAGLATGELKFNSHSPFGTIRLNRLRAYLTYQSFTQVIGADSKFTMLMMYGSSKLADNTLNAAHFPKLTEVGAGFSKDETSAFPFELDASIIETAPASIFTNVGLQSSRISIHGPFLSGTTSYRSTVTCDKGTTFGTQTGSVVAHFMIGGRQVYPAKRNLKDFTGLPAGVPDPFGMMLNASSLYSDSNCLGALQDGGSGSSGSSASSTSTLTLPSPTLP